MANEKKSLINQDVTSKPVDVSIDTAGELQSSIAVVSTAQEIQAAVFLAKKFPRNYNAAWQRLQTACKRPALAERAEYLLPRAGKLIPGASVHLARVAAQCYENIRWGMLVLRDDVDNVLIECWAWDIERNIKVTAQDAFKKLVKRKATKDLPARWIVPDEGELRMMTNRRAAISVRNCLLSILPVDYIDDAKALSRRVCKGEIKDFDFEVKQIIARFTDYGVTVKMVNDYLGHEEWTTDDLLDLRAIVLTIKDGAASVSTYFGDDPQKPKIKEGNLSEEDMSPGDPADHQDVKPETKKNPKKDSDEKPAEQGDLTAGF